nr:hypothetical protein [uncultured Sphingomonas sp.]
MFTTSACATPKERIADSLAGYGLDAARADCVGTELQRNLSLSQLQELGRAARAFRERDPNPSRLTVDDLLRVASQVRDPRFHWKWRRRRVAATSRRSALRRPSSRRIRPEPVENRRLLLALGPCLPSIPSTLPPS